MSESNAVERLVTVGDVAERFGVSERTVHRWLKETDIPYRQPAGPGTVIRFDLSEVEAWSVRSGKGAA